MLEWTRKEKIGDGKKKGRRKERKTEKKKKRREEDHSSPSASFMTPRVTKFSAFHASVHSSGETTSCHSSSFLRGSFLSTNMDASTTMETETIIRTPVEANDGVVSVIPVTTSSSCFSLFL